MSATRTAEQYIRDWCPDSVRDYVIELTARAERAERALADAVAAEREAIARMCDERGVQHYGDSREDCWATKEARIIAAAIRARGQPQPEHDKPGPSSTAFDDMDSYDWRERK